MPSVAKKSVSMAAKATKSAPKAKIAMKKQSLKKTQKPETIRAAKKFASNQIETPIELVSVAKKSVSTAAKVTKLAPKTKPALKKTQKAETIKATKKVEKVEAKTAVPKKANRTNGAFTVTQQEVTPVKKLSVAKKSVPVAAKVTKSAPKAKTALKKTQKTVTLKAAKKLAPIQIETPVEKVSVAKKSAPVAVKVTKLAPKAAAALKKQPLKKTQKPETTRAAKKLAPIQIETPIELPVVAKKSVSTAAKVTRSAPKAKAALKKTQKPKTIEVAEKIAPNQIETPLEIIPLAKKSVSIAAKVAKVTKSAPKTKPALKKQSLKKTQKTETIKAAKLLAKFAAKKAVSDKLNRTPVVQHQKNKHRFDAVKLNRGVVLVQHLPHGFFEDQLEKYFTQFGEVTRLRVARSEKTGRSKGFAYIEFKYPEVAQVAAESMNNYLMFRHILTTVYIPPQEQTHNYFHQPVKFETLRDGTKKLITPTLKRAEEHVAKVNAPVTDEQHAYRVHHSKMKISTAEKKLAALGIKIDLSDVLYDPAPEDSDE